MSQLQRESDRDGDGEVEVEGSLWRSAEGTPESSANG